MKTTLKEKVIIVTGASRGIGATVVKELAAAGAKVVVNYANSEKEANAVVEGIIANGGEAIAVKADVSKAAEVTELFDTTIAHFGKVDVLVNNAGIMITKFLKDTTEEDFDRQYNINVKGTFNTMKEAATKLSANGSIVNFSTSVSRLMLPTYGTYGATKAAVEQLTRVFAKEIGGKGINVNAVSPGPTNTELFTAGKPQEVIDRAASLSAFNRLGQTDDIAKVVVFLASDDAKWISGQSIGANGGMA